MFPNHENLLYSTYEKSDAMDSILANKRRMVAKPKYGREGQGVVYSDGSPSSSAVNQFLREADSASSLSVGSGQKIFLGDPIYQEYHPTRRFSGRKIVIGSWVIHGQPCGICIREDSLETTVDNSSFVPHYIEDGSIDGIKYPSLNDIQAQIRKELYKKDDVQFGDDHPVTSGSGHSVYNWFRESDTSRNNSTTGGTASTGSPQGASSTTSSSANNTKESMKERIKTTMKNFHERKFPNGIGDYLKKYKNTTAARQNAKTAARSARS